ncbi:hypothetical protein CDL60_14005 [Roseateles noduli]|nr:hypothetical protein CDL60_14005 [Roseateles noduli]
MTSTGALTEEQLQVLGALPFDPSRANPKALALLAELQRRALVDIDRESQALILGASGRRALVLALHARRTLICKI